MERNEHTTLIVRISELKRRLQATDAIMPERWRVVAELRKLGDKLYDADHPAG